MSAAAKRERTENGIYKVEEDSSTEEDATFSAETRVGEQAYLAIAQLMSFETSRECETLPPPSGETSVTESGVRALRETPTMPAPPIGAPSDDEPPVEQTQLLVTSPHVRRADPITLPSLIGPIVYGNTHPVAITILNPAPRARWRTWSIAALILAFAFSGTVVLVMAWLLLFLR